MTRLQNDGHQNDWASKWLGIKMTEHQNDWAPK